MMKHYKVYMEHNMSAYIAIITANNEKEAREVCDGNGEIVAIKDITDDYPIYIPCLEETLKSAGYGFTEIEIIKNTLTQNIKTC